MFKFIVMSYVLFFLFAFPTLARSEEGELIAVASDEDVVESEGKLKIVKIEKTCRPRYEEHRYPQVSPPEGGTGDVEVEDGHAKVTGHYKNGKMVDDWTYYWDGASEYWIRYDSEGNDNQSSLISHFAEVYDDGPCEDYTDGNLIARYAYKNNKLEGIYEEYYLNGQLKSKTTYNNGELEGPYEKYYENGQLKERSAYTGGGKYHVNIIGPYEEYYENGHLKEKSTYNGEGHYEFNRIGAYEEYYENGQLQEKRDEKDNYELYYKNGILKYKGYGHKESLIGSGVYEKYYANGQLEEKEDENHIWKSYNEEGRLLEECDTTKRYSMPCTVYNEDGTKSWSKRSVIE